jgi:hypothetical protein
MLSNHGGRQFDGVPAPIDTLAPIRDAVGDRLELIIDGGIRRGTYVVKALVLGAMPDGEWRHMGSWDPGQEALDSYRYQIAFMAYSLGLTAYHYLPAAPRTLQPDFDRLIQKMLRREV